MKSAFKNKNFYSGPYRFRPPTDKVRPSPSFYLSQLSGAERSVGGLGDHGSDAPCPPSSQSVRADVPDQHGVFEQYPAYGTSNDLTLNQCLIAGLGPQTDDSCGTGVYTRMICCSSNPDHHRYQVGGTSCKQPTCPVCWPMWAHRAADRISCRVDGFRRFDHYPPRHLIFSLGPDELDIEKLKLMTAQKAYDCLKAVFIKKAEKVGVVGGALIIHTMRTNEKVPRTDASGKKWTWVRNQGPENFFDYTEFEVHAHIAGYGYLRVPKQGEFLYKNKGPLKTRDDVEKWAYYAVSHAPVIPGKKSVVYFGACSNSKLKPTWTSRMSVPVVCSECGYPMVYEGTIEPVYMKRTFAGWTFSRWGFETKRTSKEPPAKMEVKLQTSKWFSVENE